MPFELRCSRRDSLIHTTLLHEDVIFMEKGWIGDFESAKGESEMNPLSSSGVVGTS